jgi:YVTN family beta-propeller protein
VEFRVLGPLEVEHDGRALKLGRGKQLALVALLLLNANEVVSIDRLVDELWGESPPAKAPDTVRKYVSVLQRELGDRLVAQPPGYVLRVEEGELDSEHLEQAIQGGDAEELTAALALWRGKPLSQIRDEPFAQADIARLEELRLTAIEALNDAELELGRHAGLVTQLQALVREHPLRERLREQLMLALHGAGRDSEALEAYGQARRVLEPGPGMQELERKILHRDESVEVSAAEGSAPSRAVARRSPRRRWIVIGALVLIAAVVAVLVSGRRGPSRGLSGVHVNNVGVILPKTNTIVSQIPVGSRPGPIADGYGSLWVGNLQNKSLTRIDPRRLKAATPISLGKRTPTGLAVGAGAVWVALGRQGELSRVDPQFGRVTKTVRAAGPAPGARVGSVAVGAGYLWAAYGDSMLSRILPAGVRRLGSVLVGSSPAAVVVGGDAVWVANSGDATVERFDPATFQEGPIRTINVGRQPTGLAYGSGSLWVACRGDNVVIRIDPSTNSALTIAVGKAPVSVAVGAGSAWVANSGDGTVSRVDTATNKVVRTIHVGNVPAGITFAHEAVWVAVQSRG